MLLFLPLDAALIFDVNAAIVGGAFIALLPILPKVHSPLPTEYYSVVLVVIFSKESLDLHDVYCILLIMLCSSIPVPVFYTKRLRTDVADLRQKDRWKSIVDKKPKKIILYL